MLGVRWVDERDANVERGLARTQVVSSRSEMMCAGILNVHAVRDAITPVQLICDSVPKEVSAHCQRLFSFSHIRRMLCSHREDGC